MHRISSDDKIKIGKFFNGLHQFYGSHSAMALGWSSKDNQLMRFKKLVEIGDLNNAKILDIGCGLGDFYKYLRDNYDGFSYKGIDINEGYILSARDKYPEADFELIEIYNLENNSYDFVFASGVFSYNIPNYLEKYFTIISKMYYLSRKGIAFNMLDINFIEIDEIFMAYDPKEIFPLMNQITNKVKIIQGYLDQDFTVYLYH
jgi:SAM-dependent methyltransferase